MIKAASLDTHINLLPFSRFLEGRGIRHRIIEESGQQVIWVNSETAAEFVGQSLNSYLQRPDSHTDQKSTARQGLKLSGKRMLAIGLRAFGASPVTFTLITVCILVAAASALGSEAGRVSYLFYPVITSDSFLSLLADLRSPDVIVRTLTPVFLHFGELHLVFNMLWLWYFGKQLEAIQPVWVFILLVFITGFISNTTQYLYIGYNNFGGMSGVVYGLIGYAWVIHSFMPHSYLLLNNSMFVFFVAALILMEVIASSWIATAAHVGGLVSGLLIGVAMVLYYRLVLGRQVIGRAGHGPHA